MNVRFGGFAPADLVRNDDPVSGGGEMGDDPGPIVASEILAVKENHGAIVGGAVRRDVHVRHEEVLVFNREREKVDWVRVLIRFEPDTERLHGLGAANAEEENQGDDHTHDFHFTLWQGIEWIRKPGGITNCAAKSFCELFP